MPTGPPRAGGLGHHVGVPDKMPDALPAALPAVRMSRSVARYLAARGTDEVVVELTVILG